MKTSQDSQNIVITTFLFISKVSFSLVMFENKATK